MASGFTTAGRSSGSSFTSGGGGSGGSGFTSGGRQAETTPEVTEQNLRTLFEQAGIKPPVKEERLSLLGRIGAGLSAFETGNAVATGLEKKSVLAGVGSYVTGVAKGLGSAITGRDFGQTEKKTYADIAEKYGVTNSIAKFGLGFVGDILLDPSTYLGGAVAKGALKGVKAGTKAGLKGVAKVAPDVAKGLTMTGKGVQDALGKAFVFGYGTSKGLSEKALEVVGKKAASREGIIISNLRRLGTNTLSESQMQEVASKLLAGKRTEYELGKLIGSSAQGKKLVREALSTGDYSKIPAQLQDALKVGSNDPKVREAIASQLDRSLKFAKQSGIDDPYSIYFPGIRKDALQKFFDNTKSLRIGSEGYLKEFKNLLKDEDLVLNPAEAFAKREVQMASDNIVRNELGSMVREFGKPLNAFKSSDEALQAGYKLVKEKGAFGKGIGYLKEVDKKFIDDLISPEFSTIDTVAKGLGFDAVTSLFKRGVTGLFPSFHVRNYVSGMMQNYEVLGAAVFSPKNISAGHKIALALARGKSLGKDVLEIGGKSYSINKVMKPFTKRFGTSSQYIADIADATATGKLTRSGRLTKSGQITSLNPLSADSLAFRKARAVGNFIETQQKAVAYVTALRQGKSVKEALELATRAGFDYRALTGFESKVLRRIIPFYSFTRKNIELQLRTLGENPQRINNILKIMRNAQNVTPEERRGLPDYAKEQFTFKIGKDYAVGLGSPIEQINQQFGPNPIRRLAASMNPVFKAPLERAFNKDFFRDRPLTEVIQAGEYAKAPKIIKNFLQVKEITTTQKDGTKTVKYVANPYRLQLLRNLPTTRGATYVSAIFDDRGTPSKILSAFTGVKPRPIDLETVEYFRNRDRQKELEQLLYQSGVLKKFETVYKPKNQTIK